MKRNSGKNEAVEYTPTFSQNAPMRGFSVYNSEGDIYYKSAVERMAYELRRELYPETQTFLPEMAQAIARLVAIYDLPSPAMVEVNAMTFNSLLLVAMNERLARKIRNDSEI